jgi:hypothetical protein
VPLDGGEIQGREGEVNHVQGQVARSPNSHEGKQNQVHGILPLLGIDANWDLDISALHPPDVTRWCRRCGALCSVTTLEVTLSVHAMGSMQTLADGSC